MRITLGAGSKKGSNLLGCGDQDSIELAMKSTHAGCVRSQEKSRHAGCVRSQEDVRFHWPEYLMEAGELTLYMGVGNEVHARRMRAIPGKVQARRMRAIPGKVQARRMRAIPGKAQARRMRAIPMSMNPARTFGSALHAGYWHGL